jgi:hypothetical protein
MDDEHIARGDERLHLASEDLVEAQIVARGGDQRRVGRQGDGGSARRFFM